MLKLSEMFVKRFGNREGYDDGKIYTEVLGNTVYKTYQNGVIRFKKRADKTHNTVEENKNNLEWLVPKIPFKYYQMTLDFYKDVNEKYGTEACVLFYWNKDNVEIPKDLLDAYGSGIIQDGQLIVIAPKQTNSSSLSEFVETVLVDGKPKKVLTEMVAWLEENTVCIAETHSHNSMQAFWSPTDDANEQHSRLRLFVVFGKVSTEEATRTRVCCLTDYFDLGIDDVFDMPIIEQKTVKSVILEGKVVNTNFPEQIVREVYTGPFGFQDTHPDSWYELFTAKTYRDPFKGNLTSEVSSSDVAYLTEEDEEMEDDDFFDVERGLNTKRIMSMTDEEYFRHLKDRDLGI